VDELQGLAGSGFGARRPWHIGCLGHFARLARRNDPSREKELGGNRWRAAAKTAAILYSVLESAKLANISPKKYLTAAVRGALEGREALLPHEFQYVLGRRACSNLRKHASWYVILASHGGLEEGLELALWHRRAPHMPDAKYKNSIEKSQSSYMLYERCRSSLHVQEIVSFCGFLVLLVSY